jgi:hypothetical protein
MMVIKPKHVGAVLMLILIFFLKQFSCASVGKYKTLIMSRCTLGLWEKRRKVVIVFVFFFSVAGTTNKYVINLGCLIPYLFLCRLTPPLAAIILLQVSLIEYLGSGPTWDKTNYSLTEMCKDNWWLALLYVQNYFSGHRMVRKL